MTLLRDVLHIPEQVHDGAFVLKLTEGVSDTRRTETLESYVVTPALADAFDRALGLVSHALESGQSQAAFVHGSFGSGKSHFMAVLHALLGHEPAARGIADLQPVLGRRAALDGRRFLRLSFHLVGADSLEAAVLSAALEQIRRLPADVRADVPLPELHESDALLRDAVAQRELLGDETFFARLGGGSSGASAGWGALAATGWDATSFEEAVAQPPGSEARGRLLESLTATFFSAARTSGQWVKLDVGLARIAGAAHAMGFDAVVLFLDELILWLVSQAGRPGFVAAEGPKVANFVEGGAAERAVPVISFLARQRNLRDFLGDMGETGAVREAVDGTLMWWEKRFDKIELGDDNLPHIAQARLLRPRDEAARETLDASFRALDRRPAVWDVLLDGVGRGEDTDSHGSDQESFRRTYPFSPALVATLRAVAGALQRERTALTVMQRVLVAQRDTLAVDDVVPVGDVYDHVVQGNEALTPDLERQYSAARRLWSEKLRPAVLREHRVSEDEADALPPDHAARRDERLAKTILLASLVPAVPALRNLTASRIAALNLGSVVSPVPGVEAPTVLGKLRQWQTSVPEITLSGDSANPTVSLRLAEVDWEGVVERARSIDTEGQRRQTLQELVRDALGLGAATEMVTRRSVVWRGTRREAEVVFGNVRSARDLPDDAFRPVGDAWRVVVDHPFDEAGHGRRDDVARLEGLRSGGATSRTVAWLPLFLSEERMRDLGTLVVLDHLLGGTGARYDAATEGMGAIERAQIRSILTTQRGVLRERMTQVLAQAYGITTPVVGDVVADDAEPRVLHSLDPDLHPAPPVAPTLSAALDALLDQALSAQHPDHPRVPGEGEVRPAEMRTLLEHARTARTDASGAGRATVERKDRPALARLAGPLGLGELHDNIYQLDGATFRWRNDFSRLAREEGVEDAVPVRRLRAWLDPDGRRGLTLEMSGLVALVWGVLEDRAWYRGGTRLDVPPEVGRVPDDAELRRVNLPGEDAWGRAVARAATVLGVAAPRYLTASNVATLDRQVRERARTFATAAPDLETALDREAERLGLDAASARVRTARAGRGLVDALTGARDGVALVAALAADPGVGDDVLARSLASAVEVTDTLRRTQWDVLDLVEPELPARAGLREAAAADELVAPLGAALQTAVREVLAEVRRRKGDPPAPPPRPPGGGTGSGTGSGARGGGAAVTHGQETGTPDDLGRLVDRLRREHPGRQVQVTWRVVG